MEKSQHGNVTSQMWRSEVMDEECVARGHVDVVQECGVDGVQWLKCGVGCVVDGSGA